MPKYGILSQHYKHNRDKFLMRQAIGILAIYFLSGCASSPPKPPTFKGEYRPINKVAIEKPIERKPISPSVFDFKYEGDIVNSLNALYPIQQQLNILPPLGKISPLPISVNLRSTTLENALRAIGDQGGDIADVILNNPHPQGNSQVFIRFRTPHQQANEAPTAPKSEKN